MITSIESECNFYGTLYYSLQQQFNILKKLFMQIFFCPHGIWLKSNISFSGEKQDKLLLHYKTKKKKLWTKIFVIGF